MTLLQLATVVAVIGLGARVMYSGWHGDPPAHVSSGMMGIIMGSVGLAEGNAAVTAIMGLHAGWQFACAYMIRAGRPRVVRVHLYLDEDGQWEQSEHPSQYGKADG